MKAELAGPDTGGNTEVEASIAALGYSYLIYAETTMSQWLPVYVEQVGYELVAVLPIHLL